MELWQKLIQEDRRLNLSRADVAETWFRPAAKWDMPTKATWQRSIKALRSIVRRLHPEVEVQGAEMESATEADNQLYAVIGRLTVHPRIKTGTPPGAPLTENTFLGLRLVPGQRGGPQILPEAELLDFFDQVWRSLASAAIADPVCPNPGCRNLLPPTAGGKRNAQKQCAACRRRESAKRRDPEITKRRDKAKKARRRQQKLEAAIAADLSLTKTTNGRKS